MVLKEILEFGYEVFMDAAKDQPQSSSATRMVRMRRTRGTPPRYTPEMQLANFIKEARKANFNILDNKIDTGGSEFGL